MVSSIWITACTGYHYHEVMNVGDQMLYGVEMQCGERSFGYGYLSPGVHKGYSGTIRFARGDIVIIEWSLDEENKRCKEVLIDKSTTFKDVVFLLDGQNVTVDYE